jgi:hypothetical protein
METHEWFTLAEAAEILGADDGAAGIIRLFFEGMIDHSRLTASYMLPTPWKAHYIERIESPSDNGDKLFYSEFKGIRARDILVSGLVDLDFYGDCRNSDGSVTIRNKGDVYHPGSHRPQGRIRISLPGKNLNSPLYLVSTGETLEELQDCLTIRPTRDLIVTKDHLKAFAVMIGDSTVLAKLKSLPVSRNVAATTIEELVEYEFRREHKSKQEDVEFDATMSEKSYQVPEGHESVRLVSTSGHIALVGEEPRHIPVGFEQEALEQGCIATMDKMNTLPIDSKVPPDLSDAGKVLQEAQKRPTPNIDVAVDAVIAKIDVVVRRESANKGNNLMINHVRFLREHEIQQIDFAEAKKRVAAEIMERYGHAGFIPLCRRPKNREEPYLLPKLPDSKSP